MATKKATATVAKKSLINSDLLAGFVLGFIVGVLFLSFLGKMMM